MFHYCNNNVIAESAIVLGWKSITETINSAAVGNKFRWWIYSKHVIYLPGRWCGWLSWFGHPVGKIHSFLWNQFPVAAFWFWCNLKTSSEYLIWTRTIFFFSNGHDQVSFFLGYFAFSNEVEHSYQYSRSVLLMCKQPLLMITGFHRYSSVN